MSTVKKLISTKRSAKRSAKSSAKRSAKRSTTRRTGAEPRKRSAKRSTEPRKRSTKRSTEPRKRSTKRSTTRRTGAEPRKRSTKPRKRSTTRRTGAEPRKDIRFRMTPPSSGRMEQLYDIRNGEVLNPFLRRNVEGRTIGAIGPVNTELPSHTRNWDWPQPYQFGSEGRGPGQFSSPQGVAISSTGDIVVCDTGNDRIQVFRQDGKFVCQWGYDDKKPSTEPGQFNAPWSVAVSSTDEVFVADHGHNCIQVCKLDGTFVRSWGSKGKAQGEFNEPTSVAIHNQNVFVVDNGNNRIQVFTLDGKFVRSWGSKGDADGEFRFSEGGLAVSADGNVFVCDGDNYLIQVFDLDGKFITKFGGRYEFESHPQYVTISSTGKVLVSTETGVVVFNTDGTYDRNMSMGNDVAGAMAVTPNDNLIVCDDESDIIYVLPAGTW